jgi:hypothetical protein
VVGKRLDIGDAGDVRAATGLQLDGQLLHHDLIADIVENDVDVGVVLVEAVDQVLDDLALDTVRIPHEPHVSRLRGRRCHQRGRDRRKCSPDLHCMLLRCTAFGR